MGKLLKPQCQARALYVCERQVFRVYKVMIKIQIIILNDSPFLFLFALVYNLLSAFIDAFNDVSRGTQQVLSR